MSEPGPDSLEAFTGDRAAAEQLRRSLTALRDEYAGSPLADQLDDVLTGREDFRTLADDPEFASLAHEGARKFQEYWASLSADQRAELARAGEATLHEIEGELDS